MKKVLVIIDMQNDFITGSLGSEYARDVVLPNVVKKIEGAKADLIIFTRDTHPVEYLNTHEGRNLPVPHCIEGTDGWRIPKVLYDALEGNIPCDDEGCPYVRFVDKNTFGSFDALYYAIESNIPSNEDLEIEICGLCTDICVISNALILRAAFPEVDIICDTSCCGGTSKEAHDAAVLVMKSCQIKCIN